MSARTPLLEVQDLSLSFGGLACLSNLDLVVVRAGIDVGLSPGHPDLLG